MSTAVIGAPAPHSACSARSELPHAGRSGVPYMKIATGSPSITCWISSRSVMGWVSLRRDSELVDRAVGQWFRERSVDEAVLLDERQPLERRAPDRHVEVIAAARAVDDVHARVGERLLEKASDRVAHHRRSC
jgi:hypothetical protein